MKILPIFLFAMALSHGTFLMAQITDYPSKSVRILVGYPPGGSNDTLARMVAQNLTDTLRQPFLVDNKPGGNTIIAADLASKAPPDGYTLMVAASSAMTINPVLYKTLPYDPEKSFVPITLLGSFPLMLVTNVKSTYPSLADLVQASKREAKGISYGSASLGHQLATEEFRRMSGADVVHIPYKGSAQTLNGLLAGDVRFALLDLSPVVPHIDSGALRPLAISTAKRFPKYPNVPTIAEAGVPGYDLKLWVGLFAPAGTPPQIIMKIQSIVSAFLQKAETRDKLMSMGLVAGGDKPEEVKAMIQREAKRFSEIIKEANIKLE
jgi:tripartite-type tricarboxylate transporter receptor subunit TctC